MMGLFNRKDADAQPPNLEARLPSSLRKIDVHPDQYQTTGVVRRVVPDVEENFLIMLDNGVFGYRVTETIPDALVERALFLEAAEKATPVTIRGRLHEGKIETAQRNAPPYHIIKIEEYEL